MKPEIKCRRAVVNLNLQEIQALNDYRIAYGRRGFKCARSAMEKVIEAWKVAGAENATTTEKSSVVGNAAAMRKALEKIQKLVTSDSPADEIEIANICYVALAAPPRNCDVGAEQEQAERYRSYCDKFTLGGMHCETCPCCGKIPFGKCEFAWANMPYMEGGAK